jgi:hypothetical protein
MTEVESGALRRALVEVAGGRRTVTYQDLAVLAAVPAPHRIHKLTLALEDLIRADHAAGRPLLAAVAISRARNGIPGPGFFHLLAELGRYAGPDAGPAAAEAHAGELEAAWAHWGARQA